MRKSFLMKFLALFLTGTMLVGVGCKNYDDDINEIKEKIDGMTVTLNSLESRMKAVEATAAEFKAIDFKQFVKDADLTTKLSALQTEFTNKLAGYVTTGQLNDAKNTLQAAINAKTDLATVQNLLNDYAKKADTYDKAAVDALLKKITDNTDNWLGDHFAKYLTGYVTGAEFQGAASDAVLAQLNAANADYVAAISKMLDGMTGEEKILRQKDLDTALEGYEAEIEALWTALGQLSGRIQSLVYVPTTADGTINYGAQTAGAIELTETAKAEVTFRVTPASLAKALVDGFNATTKTVEMYFEAEEVTRASLVNIIKAEAGENGKITLLTDCAYDFTTNSSKTLAIALNISDVEDIAEGVMGNNFSSAYVPVDNDSDDLIANFMIAKKDATGEWVAATNAVAYEVEYNDLTTVTALLNDYTLVYKTAANKYLTMAEAKAEYNWDIAPVLDYKNEAATTNGLVAQSYKVTPATVLNTKVPVRVQLTKEDTNNIDKTYVQPTILSLVGGTETVSSAVELTAYTDGKVTSTLTVTKENLGEITGLNATFNWNYVEYVADEYVSADVVLPVGKLTAAQFKAIDWDRDVTFTLEHEAATIQGVMLAKAEAVSNPTVDTDAQIIRLKVTGYKNGTGPVTLEGEAPIGTYATVDLSGELTFNGLPDMAYEIKVAAPVSYAIATTVNVEATTTLNTALYAALPAGQTYFADQNAFDTFLQSLGVKEADQAKDADKKIAGADVVASNNNKTLTVQFVKDDVDFNVANTYTYTAPEKARIALVESIGGTDTECFKVALTGAVTIDKTNGYYLGQGTSLIVEEGKTPYQFALGATNVGTPTFTVANAQLSTGYGAKVPANNAKTVVTTYSLVTAAPTGYNGTLPTIDGGTSGTTGVMVWNGCQLDKVVVKAVMTVDGLTVDTKEWEIVLQKPIDFAAWTAFPTKAVKVTEDALDVPLNAIMAGSTNPATSYSRDIFGNVVLDNTGVMTWAANAAAYELALEFGDASYSSTAGAEVFTRFSLDKTQAKLVIEADNTQLQGTVTVTIPVTFTYKYALTPGTPYTSTKFTKTVTITVTKQ